MFGLRNPYGTYGFTKTPNNLVETNTVWNDNSAIIPKLPYSNFGLLGEKDQIFVQGTPITNTNVSIDNSVILVKPDGNTNVGTRFYNNSLDDKPCVIDFAIPKPPLNLLESNIPAKYQTTNSTSYQASRFYA